MHNVSRINQIFWLGFLNVQSLWNGVNMHIGLNIFLLITSHLFHFIWLFNFILKAIVISYQGLHFWYYFKVKVKSNQIKQIFWLLGWVIFLKFSRCESFSWTDLLRNRMSLFFLSDLAHCFCWHYLCSN